MRCEDARQLFDSYLDGELSPSLTAELGAHRLQCAECRRSLAILEVTGHVLSSDRELGILDEDFTDRLLACVKAPARRFQPIRRYLYVGPLAAAAVIALAFLGFFDRGRQSKVAGVKVEPLIQQADVKVARLPQAPTPEEMKAADRALDEWIEQMRTGLEVRPQGGESLQKALDLTVLQILDILEELKDRSSPHFPGFDDSVPFPNKEPLADEDENVDDL